MVSLGDIGCHIVEEIMFHSVGKLGVYWVYLILLNEIIILIDMRQWSETGYSSRQMLNVQDCISVIISVKTTGSSSYDANDSVETLIVIIHNT